MIALPQRLPYVAWRSDRLLPLSESWLTESIHLGAARAGCGHWDLSSHIARAIALYLEDEFDATTITVPQLEEMISRSIEKVGYAQIAQATVLVPPRLTISLAEIADRASFELLFFPLLRERLDDAMRIEARGVVFGDLRPCVKILDAASHWRRTCEMLRGEIVTYIREYLAGAPCRSLDFAIT